MLRFYGASDDLCEIDGDIREELDNCANGKPFVFRVGDINNGVIVIVHYAAEKESAGVWRVAAEQVDEDKPCPWPIRIETKHGYSLALVVDCPPGTALYHRAKDGEWKQIEGGAL